jgi:hypothetical protein
METLAAMAVISLAMIIPGLSLSASAGAMERAKDRALFAIQLLRADSLIRDRIGETAIPYWESAAPVIDGSSATIPWRRGEREGYARLALEEGTLVLETRDKGRQERITLLSGLDGAEFSIVRNGEGAPCGLETALERGPDSYRIVSVFATLPLAGGLLPGGGAP